MIVHGAIIGARCLIGMGSTLLNGCEIGDESIVGANALVTQGKKFPPRSLIIGSPAKVVREVTDEDLAPRAELRDRYARRSARYAELGLGADLSVYRSRGRAPRHVGRGGVRQARVTLPDLEQALAAEPAALRAGTRGADRRRQYVYWVLDAKRPETRARRRAEVVRRAAAGLKPGRRASRRGAPAPPRRAGAALRRPAP